VSPIAVLATPSAVGYHVGVRHTLAAHTRNISRPNMQRLGLDREGQIATLLTDLKHELLKCREFEFNYHRPPTPTGRQKDTGGVEWATFEPGPTSTFTLTLCYSGLVNANCPVNGTTTG